MENKKTYSEDHVTMMLEEIKGQFMAFGEGQQIITDKIDEINDRLIRVEGGLDGVGDELKFINGKLDKKAEKTVIDNHEKRIVKLEKASLSVA